MTEKRLTMEPGDVATITMPIEVSTRFSRRMFHMEMEIEVVDVADGLVKLVVIEHPPRRADA